jgi:hypothetical protein
MVVTGKTDKKKIKSNGQPARDDFFLLLRARKVSGSTYGNNRLPANWFSLISRLQL